MPFIVSSQQFLSMPRVKGRAVTELLWEQQSELAPDSCGIQDIVAAEGKGNLMT